MLSRDVTKKMSDEVVEICIWKTILPFFFVKTHFSSFFGSITGFCQIRYFSNIRVRFFFQQHAEKTTGLLRVSASTRIKYEPKYAYGHFLGTLRGLPIIDKK